MWKGQTHRFTFHGLCSQCGVAAPHVRNPSIPRAGRDCPTRACRRTSTSCREAKMRRNRADDIEPWRRQEAAGEDGDEGVTCRNVQLKPSRTPGTRLDEQCE
jgi:hypothetical protein